MVIEHGIISSSANEITRRVRLCDSPAVAKSCTGTPADVKEIVLDQNLKSTAYVNIY